MDMKKVMTYAVFAALVASTPVSAFNGRLGYQSVALSNTVFEVIPRGRTDVDGYWCAASDFARRTLGADWKQRIYVKRGYGPSEATGRRTAVQFSLTAPEGAPQQSSGIITVGFQPGFSMSVSAANGRCNTRPFVD
ncbi:hypothetical protein RUE5091_01084 [Ruegeria denitrificans]|uniref:Uncharacterized protein n=1 Tax=Ruegeria denitrificans TaxID=1715692 RepID=A0A0P1I5E9_9RHOB|nr:hypothetical protein [Ruegeria denitrificans]CUJ91326.1 hypothetical protein RUE5091_01084 [Ruegeria denitrificans]